jgi:hypothetical protein
MRMNNFNVIEQNENTCTSANPNTCVDDIYTTNSIGVPSKHYDSNPLGSINMKYFDKKQDKIFINCPKNYSAHPYTLKCSSTDYTSHDPSFTAFENYLVLYPGYTTDSNIDDILNSYFTYINAFDTTNSSDLVKNIITYITAYTLTDGSTDGSTDGFNDFEAYLDNYENTTDINLSSLIRSCRPSEPQVPKQDYITGFDTTTNDHNTTGTTNNPICDYMLEKEKQIWLTKNTPAYNEFANEEQCKKWCKNDHRCGGVQTFYDYNYSTPSSTHPVGEGYTYCNYYNKNVDLTKDTDDDSNYNSASGYNTYIKRKVPYTITPTSTVPDNCKDTDIGFGCCPDGITAKKDKHSSNCAITTSRYHSNTNVNPNLTPNVHDMLGGTNERIIDAYELFTNNRKTNCTVLFTLIIIFILFYYYR